jgi:hypothetical protein
LIKSYSIENARKKCKVLDIIPHGLEGNHCEIIAFVCLRMFSSVATKNIAIGANEEVLCIIKVMQMGDADVSDVPSFDMSRGEDVF